MWEGKDSYVALPFNPQTPKTENGYLKMALVYTPLYKLP